MSEELEVMTRTLDDHSTAVDGRCACGQLILLTLGEHQAIEVETALQDEGFGVFRYEYLESLGAEIEVQV